ncbi:hypothetical protein H113_02051 [Trichophyton rubrum MR1459]|nr:hypothetical protein H113_02051 [Trichophyton rubrum MR1459]EZG08999.1 hypothetical protein H106_01909 [Trichophyton rubrum CBS 735.88]
MTLSVQVDRVVFFGFSTVNINKDLNRRKAPFGLMPRHALILAVHSSLVNNSKTEVIRYGIKFINLLNNQLHWENEYPEYIVLCTPMFFKRIRRYQHPLVYVSARKTHTHPEEFEQMKFDPVALFYRPDATPKKTVGEAEDVASPVHFRLLQSSS